MKKIAKKAIKGKIIVAVSLIFFVYLLPVALFVFKSKTASFEFLACVFVFFQLILSDDFLNDYNILKHFNLIGQKEENYSRIQNYRMDIINLTISFLLIQSEMIFPIFEKLFDYFKNKTIEFFIINSFPKSFFTAFKFALLFVIGLCLSVALKWVEGKIAKYMKKQDYL